MYLKKLKAQHRNIIQMSFNGFTNNDIAEKLEMSPGTVSQVLRSPLGEAYMNGLHDRMQENTLDVRKQLISMNKDALAAFTRILDPKQKAPASVQFNTARDILDRNGYKAPDKLNIDMTMQGKSDEEIDAEIAAMEAAIARTPHNKPKKQTEINLGNKLPEAIEANASTDQVDQVDIMQTESVSESSIASNHSDKSDQTDHDPVDPVDPVKLQDDPIFDKLDDPTFDPFNNIGN